MKHLFTKSYRISFRIALALILTGGLFQITEAQFTSGNIAVLLDSAATTNTAGSIVELNTSTANQSAVHTYAIPGLVGTNALRFSGSAATTGYLANTNDGTFLSFVGANTTTGGATNTNTILPRGVGTFNYLGTYNMPTKYTGVSGNQPRSATSLDNTTWYIGDQGGLYTNLASAPSPVANLRSVKAFGGTVYACQASATLAPVSTVSAATGGTITGLTGLGVGTAAVQDFYFISSGSNGTTFDVLYVLSATTAIAGTIAKYSLVSGSWTANGTYTTAFGGFGLAAAKQGTGANLYATTGTGGTAVNSVIKLNDAAGYNTTINITTASNVTLYTATTPAIIKGIAFAPTAPLGTPTHLAITSINGGTSPTVSTPFNITVQSQDGTNAAAAVVANTSVTLSLATGSGVLGGTLTGTITAGTSTVIISGVTYNKAESGVSVTATRTAGDALTAGTSALFTVLAAADHVAFVGVPASGSANTVISSFTVEARRPDNSVDLNYTGNITVAKNSGPGTIGGTLTVAAVAGVATFNTLVFSQAGTYTLIASSAALTTSVSSNIVIAAGPSLTEVLLPQFIQGLNGTNTNRVPYAYRVTLSGLTASTTYKYFNSVIISSDGPTTVGAGNAIYAIAGGFVRGTTPGFTAGNFGTFTTDASGNYTGWFITETTGSATRFIPGNNVYMRIILNNGAGGSTNTTFFTTTNTAEVINLASGAFGGTPVRSTSLATAKNFVMLWDNIAGTGRPISGTYVESDGSANTLANSYAAFYANSVDAVAGAWGTIIPNSTVGFPNGIRKIQQLALTDGSTVGCAAISTTGVWPTGSVDTRNTTGGTTELVISATDAPLNAATTIWSGGGTSDWNTASNWSCGAVPNGAATDVIILSGASPSPVLSGSVSVHNIAIQGSETVSLSGNALSIFGAVTGTGTLSGSATSDLVIGGAAGTISFTAGSQTLHNLTINTASSATLGSPLDITAGASAGSVTVNGTGVLTTGGNLTLKSDANGTARVGQGTTASYISGTVTVERYISSNGGNRAWRLLSAPTSGQTINAAWQEGFMGGVVGISGFGTQITSTAVPSGANGEDSQQPNSSLGTFSAGAWNWLSSTMVPIATKSGYMMYIRGDRNIPPSTATTGANSTVLRTKGTLYEGNQTAIAVAGNTLIGNVYASTIDYASITKAGVGTSFTIWDPALAGSYNLGAYQTWSPGQGWVPGGGNYPAASPGVIQSGQAFFVSGAGTITLNETSKIATSRSVFTPLAAQATIRTNLYAVESPANQLADGNAVVFDNAYSDNVDLDDAVKVDNFGENLGMLRNSTDLIVEKRQPVITTDTIFYNMSNLRQISYVLEFVPQSISATGLTATLQDNYLGTSTPVDLTTTTTQTFAVTSNTATSAANRFRLVFNQDGALPLSFLGLTAIERTNGIQLNWKVANEAGVDHYEAERSLTGSSFGKINNNVAATGSSNYSLLDPTPNRGINFYRIRAVDASGANRYTGIVKVILGGIRGITISPNPVAGRHISLQFSNEPAGSYSISITNTAGQLMYHTTVNHDGGNSTQGIDLPSKVAPGTYQVQTTMPDNTNNIQQIIIGN